MPTTLMKDILQYFQLEYIHMLHKRLLKLIRMINDFSVLCIRIMDYYRLLLMNSVPGIFMNPILAKVSV